MVFLINLTITGKVNLSLTQVQQTLFGHQSLHQEILENNLSQTFLNTMTGIF